MDQRIVAINLDRRLAVTETGRMLPIVSFFLGDGDDCPCDPDEADECVAGPLDPAAGPAYPGGRGWFRIYIPEYTSRVN